MRGWPEWICPSDQQPLEQQSNQLSCAAGHVYPIIKGIPRFVSQSNYADHFGAQWNRYRLTQLDSYTGRPITRDRARRCLGEQLWESLSGKTILECGCGAGRFTEILLERGARVTSIDLSNAIEANALTFPQSERHRCGQADITLLPFAPAQFDVVVCLGVIQHTPSPERTVEALSRQVAPGGTLVIDHYTDGFGWYTRTAAPLHAILKRLQPGSALKATESLVKLFLPLHKAVRGRRLSSMLLHRLSPVMCYYAMFPELNDQIQYEWALLDTHDTLTDWYKHFRSRDQIRSMLEKLELEHIWCEYGGNGVEARGSRPPA
ncbi:MAG TPA: class I SAM-dependent methyltransferase [Bryobacteraceae bacterium]|nr:class I SAM-dependent methyltransferase [Bryobacteraceae bacterium]